jgi:hypothetical protein
MAARKTRDGTTGPTPKRKRRRKRGRQTPKWLLETKELDLIAQRRCLMILSVLCGEKTVEEASEEAQISPAQYYQFEKKALGAMLSALVPGASTDGSSLPAMKQMEQRLADLEVAKRRLERLLFLTRLTVEPGRMTARKRGPGRPRKPKAPVLEPAGEKPSFFQKKKWKRIAAAQEVSKSQRNSKEATKESSSTKNSKEVLKESSSSLPLPSSPTLDGEDAL